MCFIIVPTSSLHVNQYLLEWQYCPERSRRIPWETSHSEDKFRDTFMTTPVSFLRETRDELRKVTWPTRNEVIRLTLVVISVSVIVGVFIGSLDFVFTKLLQFIVK